MGWFPSPSPPPLFEQLFTQAMYREYRMNRECGAICQAGIVPAGDYVRLHRMAKWLSEQSEAFDEEVRALAHRHRMPPIPICPVCKGAGCTFCDPP
jgi:hypothetical protein